MISTMVALVLALVSIGCATPPEQSRTREGLAGDDGTAGAPGSDAFDNANFVPPPPTNASIVPGGNCKAGHYLGQLEGLYVSPAAVGFTPGGVPISTDPKFIATDILNTLFPPMGGVSPGFEFWLNAAEDYSPCEEGQEFCFDYQVEGGKARGVADGLFPFELEINGQLDCDQGKFQGLVENGWYEVAGIRFFYEGTIEGSYDAAQAAFFDGKWKVHEPADPTAGGEGTWYTAYVEEM